MAESHGVSRHVDRAAEWYEGCFNRYVSKYDRKKRAPGVSLSELLLQLPCTINLDYTDFLINIAIPMGAVCILQERVSLSNGVYTHFCIHTRRAPLPGTESKCELGPQRLVITVSINQLTPLRLVFFLSPLLSRPFLLFLPSQCETVFRCVWWLYLSVFPGVFAAGATSVHA